MHIKCRLSPIAQATTCDFRIECNNNGRAMPIRENRIYGIPSRWWFVCVCRVVSSSSHTECSEKIFILWIDYLNMCYLKTAYKLKKNPRGCWPRALRTYFNKRSWGQNYMQTICLHKWYIIIIIISRPTECAINAQPRTQEQSNIVWSQQRSVLLI